MKSLAQPGKTNRFTPLRITAGSLVILATSAALTAANSAPVPEQANTAASSWESSAYRGHVEVIPADTQQPNETPRTIDGMVFDDQNRNSKRDANEPGRPGVTVSNGREVTVTDGQGRYELPAFENMTMFVTQPRGYQVPVDEHNVAQFF